MATTKNLRYCASVLILRAGFDQWSCPTIGSWHCLCETFIYDDREHDSIGSCIVTPTACDQSWYGREIGRIVQQEWTFKSGPYSFLNIPLESLADSYAVNVIASQRFSKLLHRMPRPHQLFKVQWHTSTVAENMIQNTICFDLLTVSPSKPECQRQPT